MKLTKSVQEALGLMAPPIAVAFLQSPPAGISPYTGPPLPAGCAFWAQAQEGNSFYTKPSDHYGCAIGAYTHRIDLPEERAGELEGTVVLRVRSPHSKAGGPGGQGDSQQHACRRSSARPVRWLWQHAYRRSATRPAGPASGARPALRRRHHRALAGL